MRELKGKGLTERHALEVVVMSASALRYVARNEGNDALRAAILASAHALRLANDPLETVAGWLASQSQTGKAVISPGEVDGTQA